MIFFSVNVTKILDHLSLWKEQVAIYLLFLLCGYRKPRRLSDEQREQARLRMEKINSDDNCRED